MGMMSKNRLFPRITAQTICDDGVLTIWEKGKQLPFSVKRVYTIDHCIPKLIRGHHAHKETFQVLFCLRGSVDLLLDDGIKKETVRLTSPDIGVLIRPKIWHEMKNIQEDTLLLVFASETYDEKDYIRDYDTFTTYLKGQI